MLKNVIVILILAFSSIANGREHNSELLALADEIRSSDPEKSKSILNQIDISKLNSSALGLFRYLESYNLSIVGRLEEASELLTQLLVDNPALDLKLRALSSLLIVDSGLEKWSVAIQTATMLKEEMKNNSDIGIITTGHIKFSLMVFYNHIGEHQIALQYSKDILNLSTSARIKCLTMAEALSAQIKSMPQIIDLKDFKRASLLCDPINDSILKNILNGYLVEYFLSVGNAGNAIEILESNIASVKETKYQALIAGFYELMAETYLTLNNFPKANKYAKLILDTKEQHQYQQAITIAYKVMAEVAEQSKRFDQAFYYYKLYSEAKQLNLDQETAKLLALQKAQFDDVEKNVKIALLDKENALLKTQALLDSTSAQNKRLALALLTMVLVVFVLWTYKNRRNYLRMQHYAQTDELTGIANRHYFTQQANTAIKYCKRTDQPVSFIMFDLDYFKRINDTYGHQTGDLALKIAVDAAKLACRKNDIVGRLGGEEFGVLLPGCASHLAAFIAEKCRKAIEQADFSSSGHDLDVTASFGIADSSNCEYNFEKLFAGADFALYQSKDMGRNRIVQYQKEIPSFHI